MALTKDQKNKMAEDPGKNTGQSRDQVYDDDPNPSRENLASPSHKSGTPLKSGRDLPASTPNVSNESAAPTVVQRDPAPLPRADDPGNRH